MKIGKKLTGLQSSEDKETSKTKTRTLGNKDGHYKNKFYGIFLLH